jgi:acetyl esterase
MTQPASGRRAFLKTIGALGATAAPGFRSLQWSLLAAGAGTPAVYNPSARFDLIVSEVELRRNAAGRTLMARIYQPDGPGPFSTVLDLHGGAWNTKNRLAEEPMDRALASSGLLVVAIDLTLAPEAPYPANVQDANYAVRWLKWKAASWKGDPSRIGIFGSSSGGHIAELLAMRPRDARYNAITLPQAPGLDARVTYIAMRSPVSDPYARYQHAERMQRPPMMAYHTTYFKPWEMIFESDPVLILERREPIDRVPMLVMQGAADDNFLASAQEKFVAAYRATGGECDYEVFENADHEWVATPGPQTDRARETVKAFIARQLKK